MKSGQVLQSCRGRWRLCKILPVQLPSSLHYPQAGDQTYRQEFGQRTICVHRDWAMVRSAKSLTAKGGASEAVVGAVAERRGLGPFAAAEVDGLCLLRMVD